MALIAVRNITLHSANALLFKDASFSINEGDRVGMVGNNGSGKSTLLRCITGSEQPESGVISIARGTRIGVIEQEVPEDYLDKTLYELLEEALPEDERDWAGYKVEIALEALGADLDSQLTLVRNLSGGWQRLGLIARTNIANPDVILLDEPTNHLDLKKILHLQKWLRETVEVPYLVISHDRRFLDEVTNSTLLLRGGKVAKYRGAYSKAIELLKAEDTHTAKTRAGMQENIDRLTETADRFRQQAKGHGSERLARTAQTMLTRVERLEEEMPELHTEPDRIIAVRERELDINKPVIRIENVRVQTPDKRFLFDVDHLDLKRGDRVCILGENGSGKSMFLRAVWGEYLKFIDSPTTFIPKGVSFNQKIVMGHVDQDLSLLPSDSSLYDFFRRSFSLDHTATIGALAKAGFALHQQDALIKTLSYGERARLAFAALRAMSPNAFVLDEPTNHLDIPGQSFLAQSISELEAPCLIVSHDRAFVEEVATRYVEITPSGTLVEVASPAHFIERLTKETDSTVSSGAEMSRSSWSSGKSNRWVLTQTSDSYSMYL